MLDLVRVGVVLCGIYCRSVARRIGLMVLVLVLGVGVVVVIISIVVVIGFMFVIVVNFVVWA